MSTAADGDHAGARRAVGLYQPGYPVVTELPLPLPGNGVARKSLGRFTMPTHLPSMKIFSTGPNPRTMPRSITCLTCSLLSGQGQLPGWVAHSPSGVRGRPRLVAV